MSVPYSERREYQRDYQRKWMAARRLDFFTGKSCARCGSTKNLELDHIDPATKVSHRIWSWSEVRRQAELAKCQVLCHSCHQHKSTEQLPITHGYQAFRHGTPNMYRQGCKCGFCKLWRKNYYHEVEKRPVAQFGC